MKWIQKAKRKIARGLFKIFIFIIPKRLLIKWTIDIASSIGEDILRGMEEEDKC